MSSLRVGRRDPNPPRQSTNELIAAQCADAGIELIDDPSEDALFLMFEEHLETADGDRLIAHELAHVVQQRGAANSGPLTVSNPGDSLENEADSVADSIA